MAPKSLLGHGLRCLSLSADPLISFQIRNKIKLACLLGLGPIDFRKRVTLQKVRYRYQNLDRQHHDDFHVNQSELSR